MEFSRTQNYTIISMSAQVSGFPLYFGIKI